MIDRYFADPDVLCQLKDGPLGPIVEPLVTRLEEQLFSRRTVRKKLSQVRLLGQWMLSRRIALADLDETVARAFVACRRRRGLGDRDELRTCDQVLAMVRERGHLAPVAVPEESGPFDPLLEDFGKFLLQERGVREATASRYVAFARAFLEESCRQPDSRLKDLELVDLTNFILRVSKSTPGQVGPVFTALRALAQFLRGQGLIDHDLAMGLPRTPRWRLQALPDRLTLAEVDGLLEGQDRGTGVGIRNYAILQLLARLGLRAREVCCLTLDNVDWRTGRLLVPGKGGREDWLPLPADVGRALASYIRDARPCGDSRRIFVTAIAPRKPLGRYGISWIVRRALRRSRLRAVGGAHLLRHSLASELLHQGASLPEVGQVLRHNSQSATEIYAKVRVESLRELALPWPSPEVPNESAA